MKKTPIVEQVILLGKEYKYNLIKLRKINKILLYVGMFYVALFVYFCITEIQSKSMETILIVTVLSVICMALPYFLTMILARKAKKLHLTKLKVFVEKRKVPTLFCDEHWGYHYENDVLVGGWNLYTDSALYYIMLDISRSISWRDTSNRMSSYFSSIDVRNCDPNLKEEIFLFRNNLSCEVSSPSEKNRKKYLKDLEELESFFSSF